ARGAILEFRRQALLPQVGRLAKVRIRRDTELLRDHFRGFALLEDGPWTRHFSLLRAIVSSSTVPDVSGRDPRSPRSRTWPVTEWGRAAWLESPRLRCARSR